MVGEELSFVKRECLSAVAFVPTKKGRRDDVLAQVRARKSTSPQIFSFFCEPCPAGIFDVAPERNNLTRTKKRSGFLRELFF